MRFAAALAGLMFLTACGAVAPPASVSTQQLHDSLRIRVHAWLGDATLARADGFTYAVDVGQLFFYAAHSGDRELYDKLRAGPVARLVRDDPADEFTRGFVAWRYKPDTPHDATGTTEALRIAQGLWEGAQRFDRPDDRQFAARILRGYARHAATDQGVWLICNYYNFGTRAFATNSFLVDYDPDFVRAAADELNDPHLKEVADRSRELIAKAVAPSGLLYDIIQPEVLTLMPDAKAVVFSPNDVVQIANSATVAERSVLSNPEAARGVLDFALARRDKLNHYYLGRSGAAVNLDPKTIRYDPPHPPGPETYAVLARLAWRLGDKAAAEGFLRQLVPHAETFLAKPYEPRMYIASEILLTLSLLDPDNTSP